MLVQNILVFSDPADSPSVNVVRLVRVSPDWSAESLYYYSEYYYSASIEAEVQAETTTMPQSNSSSSAAQLVRVLPVTIDRHSISVSGCL